jgi:hypothetical protein
LPTEASNHPRNKLRKKKKAQRAASVNAAIENGGIILGMTMDECIRAAGKPRTFRRTTDAQGHSTQQWWYGAGWFIREWCCDVHYEHH